MVEVCRPSFTSLTLNVAAPVEVRRRKVRCRVRVWGWFWEERVVRKWREATERMVEVT